MSRLVDRIRALYNRFGDRQLFWWLAMTAVLAGLFFVARLVEQPELVIYQQLVVVYAVDSLLFFFCRRTLAKIGLLTLIFLISMEVMVTTFYILSLIANPTL